MADTLIDPPRSRREVLRLMAIAIGVGVLAPACVGGDPTGDGDPEPTGDALAALGRSLAAGADGPALIRAADAFTGRPLDAATVTDLLDRTDSDSRGDFAAGRTVLAQGWLLSRTEAAVLVAYARS